MNAVAIPGGLRDPRVLIVEDERVVATHVERSLQDAGYVVTGIASTAADAAALVHAALPDVALVDIRLRGKCEGFEVAERLRAEHDVPVVYMTAHTDDETLQRAARTGAYGYVVKPFTIGEVKSALQVALHKHRLDQQLADRERWFSTTLGAIADAVVACDAEEHVTFLNAAAQRLLGQEQEQARGRQLGELLGRGTHVVEVAQSMSSRSPSTFFFEATRPSSGASLLLEGSVAPIVHRERVLGAVLVLHDVTEQRRRDEQLALTDRLSSLGTLVASVAHEINNPLSYTIGNLGLAVAELERLAVELPAGPRDALDRVVRSLRDAEDGAGRVANTVKELRAFGRMEERVQRAVDPRACVDWALRLTGNQLLHHARLLTSLRDVPPVKANELKLSQVVVNLLTNAVQALGAERELNEVKVSTWTDETGSAIIEVEDNGQGMPEETRLSIFEPFFTTKPVGLGTGLGLSICRSIVQGFGGDITVESAVGHGSRFRVRLPPSQEDMPASMLRLSSVPPPPARGLSVLRDAPSILLIDDEPMIRTLVSRLLSGRYRVTTADSVRAALAVLNQRADFDAVLCDLMMPGESGMDFFGVVRRLYPSLMTRVAFITGGAVTPDTSKFLETAARPVLGKPFDAQALAQFIDRMIADAVIRAACPA
ncbi:MAG: response regulator [Myxococcales bacterium]|nr:MAG: response regulator [Myxococcales bacterium]